MAQDLKHPPLEPLNNKIKRRTRIATISLNDDASIVHLAGAPLLAQAEWRLDGRCVFLNSR